MMPATDHELTSMEDPHAVENEKGSLTDALPSVPPATIPASAPPFPTTITNFTGKAVIENRAVSMASNDCSSALSSPAEASPAKPAAVTSPTTLEGTVEASSATSHIASASDSLQCTRTSLVNIPETLQPLTLVPSPTFGCPDVEKDFPTSLTFKGITVTLENSSVWKQFHSCGTEMILTKQGRRMFPYCRYRLSGLDPERQYSLVLSIVPFDKHKYRWNKSQWEVGGRAEHEPSGVVRAFVHHYLSCKGSDWMGSLVSFYKLKLTNNSADSDGHIILHSMHRYIPRLHVIPVPDGVTPTPECPVVIGPECIIFTFPQTEFMAVTTYQNFRVTQLKINYNPFAKGFREDGNNPRLNRVTAGVQPVVKKVTEPIVIEENESREEAVDLSMKNHIVPAPLSNMQATRLVLKPIMSTPASNDEPYVPCIRGKHALGELVLVQNRPLVEPKEENHTLKAISTTPTSTTSTPKALPWSRRKRKRINRRWANSRGKEWKAVTAAASPKVVHSPSLTVAFQPELDDVEGLLFISFTSKEALDVHVRTKPASSSAPVSPVSPMSQKQLTQTVEVISETDQEKISHLEMILLQDLRVLKHRQVIHPVLQEVGLKLSSIDLAKSIDLQYLGVSLPLPPPPITQPEQCDATALSPADKRLPFISRTGKTSDMTKIKGWKNKFIKSKETSSSDSDGLQRNLSAFCSNMLDEYLESEAQQISERAAAFSTNPEGSVAYQLPAKSSSYVKTLDSALKHRNAASTFSSGASRPCPLSHKPLLYSALTSSAPPLTSSATPVQAAAQSLQQAKSSHIHSGASLTSNAASQRSPSYQPSVSQKPPMSSGQNQGMAHRPTGLTKLQMNILKMEIAALKQGVNRTQLTTDRVSEALSVILTKQMFYNPNKKAAQPKYPKNTAEGPECGQEFCRLGCVCSSLQQLNRGPHHCQRPECMFGCGCFKRKITKHISAGKKEHTQPVYSMTNMVHLVQPHPGSHSKKLWNCNIRDVDPEPLSAPKTSQCPLPPKAPRRSCGPHPTPPVREEDKDPVYRYLESMMTCARVREFNSLPPPEVTIEPKIVDIATPSTSTKQKKATTDDQPRHYYRTVKSRKPADGSSQDSTASEAEARKQIQIQSACQWDKDHKMVLEGLCRRMNQNRLSQRFYIGPYRISPVSKIFMKKPSGSIVTYRVLISKPSKASDSEEDGSDDSDEEKLTNKSFDGDINREQEEDGLTEDPEITYGVTPFLSGVLPAGKLRANTKPAGCQVSGLIQVNDKCYNQARLLLGNMGSLHPANRLAAYVTGRLHAPADAAHKDSQKPNPTQRNNTPGALRIKATGTVVPPIFRAKPTTDLKIQTPALAQFQPDALSKGFTSLPQVAQNLSIFNPLRSFISSQLHSGSPYQTSSMSSPVSLTVSPSLKTPSFLGHSGTYSFRICPPTNQNTGAQNLPGVALPGGFTLFQLPKPGADGVIQKPETVNTTDIAAVDEALPPREALFNFVHEADLDTNWLGLDILNEGKNLCSMSVEPSSSSELACNEKMPSDESDGVDSRQVESNLDIASEGESSDSSDYCGDDDEEKVDIETVEELGQQMAIAKMREAVKRMLQEACDSSDDAGAAREVSTKGQMEVDVAGKTRRTNHTVLERQRRSEQRGLFNKLQIVLRSHPRSPRHHLLTMALREIQDLVKTSKCLEEKKKKLTDMQSVYLKELSLLSGKPEVLIKHKLMDICKKQKMREQAMKWRPIFSHLLQSRAALLQANSAQPTVKPPPLLQPNFGIAKPATQNSVHQVKSQLQPDPQRNQSSAHTPVCLPTQKSEPEGHKEAPEAPEAPAQGTQSRVPSVPAAPHVTAPQDGPSQVTSTPSFQKLSVQPPKPMTLPLIRSKTGRLILPSSLKPLGQGFYTLTYMEAKEIGEKEVSTSANTQPSGVDSKSQDKSIPAPHHPAGSENRCIVEKDKTKPSNSDPECSAKKPPLSALNFVKSLLNQHSTAVEKKQEEGTAASLNKAPSAVCLNFNLMNKGSTSAIAQPNHSPATPGRRRGRPRKNPLPPESENRNHTVAEETRKSEPAETQAEATPVIVSDAADNPVPDNPVPDNQVPDNPVPDNPVPGNPVPDNPVPVKRRRGRPPKNKARPGRPVAQGGNGSSNEDKPFIPVCNYKIPDIEPNADPAATTSPGERNKSRPLTRGALGKDFPSAKKRSWIDIEKELDPELEYE